MSIEDRWSFDGMKVIFLRSDDLEISIIPELGGVIWSIRQIEKNREILAKVKDPVPLSRLQGLYPVKNLLDVVLVGGWYEVLPNVGYYSNYQGGEYGLHEESVYVPWKAMYDSSLDESGITLQVDLFKYPLTLTKHISLDGNKIIMHEQLRNKSDYDLDYAWLHHPTFGGDLIDETAEILIDDCEFEVDKYLPSDNATLKTGYRGKWPFCLDKQEKKVDLSRFPKRGEENSDDLVYIPSVTSGNFSIKNERIDLQFTAKWDKSVFPTLWMWRAFGAGKSYPYYGNIYGVAVEISTSYPSTGLAQQKQMGTAKRITGNSKVETTLEFQVESLYKNS
jgi:hypothetical protein